MDAEVVAELKELMNEVYLLGSLSHPNIMRFCAVCLDPPMIVTQYYQHGSLFELLKKARRGDRRAQAELTWSKRLDMLRDVAAGMVFLHSRRPAVVHGDLRSPNLLLDMAFDRWARRRAARSHAPARVHSGLVCWAVGVTMYTASADGLAGPCPILV